MTTDGDRVLDLTLLASGATQHVFVRTDRPDDPWVYKTPALVDAVLPAPITWRVESAAAVGWKRAALAACLAGVSRRWRRLGHALTHARVARGAGRRLALDVIAPLGALAGSLVDRALAAHARRGRVRQFARMCDILGRLRAEGGDGAVLPYHVEERRCILRVRGRAHGYAGRVLRQRRADHFFEYFEGFDRFCWDDLVAAQQSLWRHGVGLADTDEVLGPRNWALLDGRILLADTGSLTESLDRACRHLRAEHLDARERQIPQWWPERTGETLPRYCAHVRERITEARLRELWGREGRATAGRGADAPARETESPAAT